MSDDERERPGEARVDLVQDIPAGRLVPVLERELARAGRARKLAEAEVALWGAEVLAHQERRRRGEPLLPGEREYALRCLRVAKKARAKAEPVGPTPIADMFTRTEEALSAQLQAETPLEFRWMLKPELPPEAIKRHGGARWPAHPPVTAACGETVRAIETHHAGLRAQEGTMDETKQPIPGTKRRWPETGEPDLREIQHPSLLGPSVPPLEGTAPPLPLNLIEVLRAEWRAEDARMRRDLSERLERTAATLDEARFRLRALETLPDFLQKHLRESDATLERLVREEIAAMEARLVARWTPDTPLAPGACRDTISAAPASSAASSGRPAVGEGPPRNAERVEPLELYLEPAAGAAITDVMRETLENLQLLVVRLAGLRERTAGHGPMIVGEPTQTENMPGLVREMRARACLALALLDTIQGAC